MRRQHPGVAEVAGVRTSERRRTDPNRLTMTRAVNGCFDSQSPRRVLGGRCRPERLRLAFGQQDRKRRSRRDLCVAFPRMNTLSLRFAVFDDVELSEAFCQR